MCVWSRALVDAFLLCLVLLHRVDPSGITGSRCECFLFAQWAFEVVGIAVGTLGKQVVLILLDQSCCSVLTCHTFGFALNSHDE